MKLKCLIIDDELLAHDIILRYIEDLSFLEVTGQCYQAMDAIKLLNEKTVDLIFLDIQMPKIQGLDFLRTLQHKPLVIITSAYQEYALESYELDVCDYLLKPFRFDRFLKACNRAMEEYKIRNVAVQKSPEVEANPTPQNQHIFVKSDKRIIQVDLADVYYFESYGNYVKVWKQNEFILTPQTLSSIESQLPDGEFIRIHKSFIVNKRNLSFVEGNMVILKNGKNLPIGKNHRQGFKDLLKS